MRTTSADLLEFDALKKLVGRFVASPLGRAELDRVAPGTDVGIDDCGRSTIESGRSRW